MLASNVPRPMHKRLARLTEDNVYPDIRRSRGIFLSAGTVGMRVIVLASRKGGAGKTTLAAHIAVEAHCQGAGPVALFDLDPQASLSRWYNEREVEWPLFYQIGIGGIKAGLDQLRGAGVVQTVVIDTPGAAASPAMLSIVSLADLVIVPVVPSPHDIRAIENTLEMVEKADRPMEFVINNAGTSGKSILTHQAAAALSQHGTVSPVIIRTRQAFRAMEDGRVAREIAPKDKAAEEISALWKYLESKLRKQEARHARTRKSAHTI